MEQLSIEVDYDEAAGVFFGTSENIPGLTLETDTLAELIEVAIEIVPQLLESYFNPLPGEKFEIGINVRRRPDSSQRPGPHTKFIIDESPSFTATA